MVTSYYFYFCWDLKYVLLLFVITLLTYISARLIEGKRRRGILAGCAAGVLLILGILKYLGFVFHNVNLLLGMFNVPGALPAYSLAVPIGLSFYSLQALGYVIDVYRGKLKVEKNFIQYALYVAFFPTLLSGPIERGTNLLKQIRKGTIFEYEEAKKGLLLMAYGYFEKLLIANRIGLLTQDIFLHYPSKTGAEIALGTVLYGIQIYADFAGYSNIAIGAAKVLGFRLKENFRQPYFAHSIRQFWQRWHISLSSWLRDYVYIPLGGSKKGKIRTCANLMVTFIISAVWHGAGWKYIAWGGLHGIYQVAGRLTDGVKGRIYQRFAVWRNHPLVSAFQVCVTFVLVDFAWLFFGAEGLQQAFWMVHRMLTQFRLGETLSRKLYLMGMEESRFGILILEILILFVIDLLHEKGISVTGWLNKKSTVFRWSLYLSGILWLFIGIIYNYGQGAATFLYTQF